MDLTEFFNPQDGMVKSAWLNLTKRGLTGYFDITDSEYYTDDSDGPQRAQFVCAEWPDFQTANGDTLTIDSESYRVMKIQPDGTGVVTLSLLKTS